MHIQDSRRYRALKEDGKRNVDIGLRSELKLKLGRPRVVGRGGWVTEVWTLLGSDNRVSVVPCPIIYGTPKVFKRQRPGKGRGEGC